MRRIPGGRRSSTLRKNVRSSLSMQTDFTDLMISLPRDSGGHVVIWPSMAWLLWASIWLLLLRGPSVSDITGLIQAEHVSRPFTNYQVVPKTCKLRCVVCEKLLSREYVRFCILQEIFKPLTQTAGSTGFQNEAQSAILARFPLHSQNPQDRPQLTRFRLSDEYFAERVTLRQRWKLLAAIEPGYLLLQASRPVHYWKRRKASMLCKV